MIQHWQSSPHQQGSLTGGFVTGPLAKELEDEVAEEDAEEVVEGGMVVVSRLGVQSGRLAAGAKLVGLDG